ncbi:hypothetical protein [Stygiolobus azoricus]|nr:hypothetical protein [Stygiolobus azoricus]
MKTISLRKKRLERYFSTLNKEDAKELMKKIKEMREKNDESISRKLSNY